MLPGVSVLLSLCGFQCLSYPVSLSCSLSSPLLDHCMHPMHINIKPAPWNMILLAHPTAGSVIGSPALWYSL
ncbi:hypothetical protein V8D89_005714 [Ganoderma adspersum]